MKKWNCKSIPVKKFASVMLLAVMTGLMPGCSKAEPLDFSSASVYQLAESYGFEVTNNSRDITDKKKDGDFALMYATTDPDTATRKYDEIYNLQDFSPDCNATEFFLLLEKIHVCKPLRICLLSKLKRWQKKFIPMLLKAGVLTSRNQGI